MQFWCRSGDGFQTAGSVFSRQDLIVPRRALQCAAVIRLGMEESYGEAASPASVPILEGRAAEAAEAASKNGPAQRPTTAPEAEHLSPDQTGIRRTGCLGRWRAALRPCPCQPDRGLGRASSEGRKGGRRV